MRYILINRKKSFDAKNDTDFISWMRKKDVQFFKSNKEFMEGYAHRKETFEKIALRWDSEKHFIEDLIRNNLLKIENIKSIWNFLLNKKTN